MNCCVETAASHDTLLAAEPALPPAARNTIVLSVLGVHVLAAWALVQVESVRDAVAEAAPLFVSLVAPSAPPQPDPPPAPPTPRPKTAPPTTPRWPAVPVAPIVLPPTI